MAYIIYNKDVTPNNFHRITNNETEKTEWLNRGMLAHSISESDFNDLKNQLKYPESWDGTSVTYTNTGSITTEAMLIQYINGLKEDITQIISEGADSSWQTYLNYLESFDTSTVTFPIDSWEKYCSDNSITYQSLITRF